MWGLGGLVGAVAPLIAAELGRRAHAVRDVRRSVRMGLWCSIILGLVGMAVCWNGEALLLVTGQAAEISARAGHFLDILAWAMIPAIMATVLRMFVSALGRASYATAITFLALCVNALGNWLLVFGNLGAPALGLQGSAIASVTTSVATIIAYAFVIRVDRRLRRFRIIGNFWRAEWRRFREIWRIGTPIALTVLAEAGLFSAAGFLMGWIGEAQLAAHAIALQVASVAFMVPYGISQAATIRVGMAYGACDADWVARAGRCAAMLGIGFMAATALVIWAFPRLILSAYVDVDAPANAAMVGFALQFLVVAAAFQLFDGAQVVMAGALRGLQDTRLPMVIALFGYWVPGFGVAYVLGFHTPLAGTGIWFGLATGLIVVSIMLLARWKMRARLGLLPD
jgi:MATE family multidrug resistance protein